MKSSTSSRVTVITATYRTGGRAPVRVPGPWFYADRMTGSRALGGLRVLDLSRAGGGPVAGGGRAVRGPDPVRPRRRRGQGRTARRGRDAGLRQGHSRPRRTVLARQR